MRRPLAWIAALGIAIAACVVNVLLPEQHLTYSTNATRIPFDLPLAVGQTTTGRTFSARPTAIRAATTIETAFGDVARGTFVIVDLVVDSTGADARASLVGVELEAAGRTYGPTGRIPGTLEDARLRAGLPIAGSLVFELPPDAMHGAAVMRLATALDVRFDDRLVLDIDLDAIEVAGSAVVEEAEWAE